ncbi:hypothetical protein MY11210_003399 [Beauveria gryllotalpidicola]
MDMPREFTVNGVGKLSMSFLRSDDGTFAAPLQENTLEFTGATEADFPRVLIDDIGGADVVAEARRLPPGHWDGDLFNYSPKKAGGIYFNLSKVRQMAAASQQGGNKNAKEKKMSSRYRDYLFAFAVATAHELTHLFIGYLSQGRDSLESYTPPGVTHINYNDLGDGSLPVSGESVPMKRVGYCSTSRSYPRTAFSRSGAARFTNRWPHRAGTNAPGRSRYAGPRCACGFLFSPRLAPHLGVPFAAVRNKGELPGACTTSEYDKYLRSTTQHYKLSNAQQEYCSVGNSVNSPIASRQLPVEGGSVVSSKEPQTNKENHERAVQHLDAIFRGAQDSNHAACGAHRDFEWASLEISYGLFLSDHAVLDMTESELVILPAIMCQDLKGPTDWHLKGCLRLGLTRQEVAAVQKVIERILARGGGKLSQINSVWDIHLQ